MYQGAARGAARLLPRPPRRVQALALAASGVGNTRTHAHHKHACARNTHARTRMSARAHSTCTHAHARKRTQATKWASRALEAVAYPAAVLATQAMADLTPAAGVVAAAGNK